MISCIWRSSESSFHLECYTYSVLLQSHFLVQHSNSSCGLKEKKCTKWLIPTWPIQKNCTKRISKYIFESFILYAGMKQRHENGFGFSYKCKQRNVNLHKLVSLDLYESQEERVVVRIWIRWIVFTFRDNNKSDLKWPVSSYMPQLHQNRVYTS